MNEKLELLNGLQAELEGLGIRVSRIAVTTKRRFEDDGIEDVEVQQLTMPCQSGYYHAECIERDKGAYEVTIVREIQAQVRGIESRLRESILVDTVRQLDGPTLRRMFIAAVTKFSAPVMQDFAMVCANWPVVGAELGLTGD